MKSPAVLSALKAQKRTKPKESLDLPKADQTTSAGHPARTHVRWPRFHESFLLIRGFLIPPTDPQEGELNHEA